MNHLSDFLKRLINWFLGKSTPKLETLEQETIEGKGLTLIRYRRKTYRAYRTWRAVYKTLEYDLIFGWDTLEYLPDRPHVHKKNRLSTHIVHIYSQGLHARFNPRRGCHEPDIRVLLHDEVSLEAMHMAEVVQRWRLKTARQEKQILTREAVYDLIIDEVAKYALRHPPGEIMPTAIDWREVVRQTVCLLLWEPNHKVFPDVSKGDSTMWQG